MCSSKFTMYTAFVLPDVGGGGGIRQQPRRDNPGFHVQLQELEKSPQGEEEARWCPVGAWGECPSEVP